MQMRIQKWAASGVGGGAGTGTGGKDKNDATGRKELERLWESVKGVERREGVVVEIVGPGPGPGSGDVKEEKMDVDEPHSSNLVNGTKPPHIPNGHLPSSSTNATPAPASTSQPTKPQPKWNPKAKSNRELARLHPLLDKILLQREQLTKRMDVVGWRERLTEQAVQRSETAGFDECGWDQRMCLDDEEVKEYGAGVLESYEEEGQREGGEGATGNGNGTPREGEGGEEGGVVYGEWWCRGKKKCDRHAGYVSFSSPSRFTFSVVIVLTSAIGGKSSGWQKSSSRRR